MPVKNKYREFMKVCYILLYFGPGCSMFFVRLSDRKQWVWSGIARVYMLALAYTGLYLAVEVLVALHSVTEPRLDRQLCLTVIELMMLLSLVFMVTCLLANVVSIRCGTAIGIFGVFILVMLLETVGIMLFDRKLNVILNPFCFHSDIVNTPSVACMKIAIDLILCTDCFGRYGWLYQPHGYLVTVGENDGKRGKGMQHILQAENISKKACKKELLRGISLELKGGAVYGFIGENGAGKTMLFRVLSGLVKPSESRVLLARKIILEEAQRGANQMWQV